MTTRTFSVWAPAAARVEVVVDGARHAMTRGDDGTWTADVDAPAGARYAFSIDGADPLPDPRSRAQPDGVHAASQVVDLATFRWSDDGFQPPPWSSALIYELHVGAFTPEGTFDAVAGKLEHLIDLGVTHVELMPVAAFPGVRGWGYDGVQLYAAHAAYGGAKGLMRLVDACHARGLAVILDVVYNHLGPSGNYLPRYAPYFTDAVRTPWGDAVNLDGAGSDEVRRFLLDNAAYWLRDLRLDGLRLDAVHALIDRSATPFLEELAALAERLSEETGRAKVLIAESDLNDPRVVRPRRAHGLGLDAAWSDDLHHALHVWLTGEKEGYYADYDGARDVAKALSWGFVYDGQRAPSRGRRHGRRYDERPSKLLGYAQTHDQVGNRARGERLSHLTSTDRAKIAAAIVATSAFTPMLFMGEEWAATTPFQYFTDHDDPVLGAAVTEGRRREFAAFVGFAGEVPDPQAEETFRASCLDWSERARAPHADVLAFYAALYRLRRTHPSLREDAFPRARASDDGRVLIVERGALVVVANLGPAASVPLPQESGARLLLASSTGVEVEGVRVHLPADAVAILERA